MRVREHRAALPADAEARANVSLHALRRQNMKQERGESNFSVVRKE